LAKLPKELTDRIAAVTNKRAKIVVDHIAKNGAISTEELKKIGYDHRRERPGMFENRASR
jgi:hypothetical protein